MAAAIFHWTIDQGATATQLWQYAPNGVPANLAGWTARLMVRANVADASPLLSLTSPSGGLTISGADVVATVTAAQAAALAAGVHVYDVEIVAPGGDVVKLSRGTLTVRAEVTR